MDVITGEFKDLSCCHRLTLSRDGRTALLAGKKVYGLVSLNDVPVAHAVKVNRKSKGQLWDVKYSRLRDDLVAEATDDRLILMTVVSGGIKPEPGQSARVHTREISSIDWHPIQHNLIGVSSLDRNVFVWDVREHFKKPSMKFSCGSIFASKIAWEKVDGILLATSNDTQLSIWDQRRLNHPIAQHVNSESDLPNNPDFLGARSRRILDVDFSPVVRNLVSTGSSDSLVRVFRADQYNEKVVIQMPQKTSPVTKVKQTPFGKALVSLVKSNKNTQKHSMYYTRENNLTLWTSLANKRVEAGTSVHTFYGHNDIVLDYDWVGRIGDMNDWKLVTWSRDNTLKLWPIRENLLEVCGWNEAVPEEPLPLPSADRSDEFDASPLRSSLSMSPTKRSVKLINLHQEFASVKFGDRVSIETLDTSKTSDEPYGVVVGETNTQRIYFQVKFPEGYAYLQEPPRFSMITGTTLDQATGFKIQHKVQKEAVRLTQLGERCLEACFELFEKEVEKIFRQEHEEIASGKKVKQLLTGNDAVPFPRTSGARFCGLGQLVCFGWSYSVKVEDVSRKQSVVPPRVAKTPRSLSALSDSTILMNPQDQPDGSRRKESIAINLRKSSKVSFDPRFISSAKVEDEDSSMLSQFLQYKNRFSELESSETPNSTETKKFVTIYDTLPMLSFSKNMAQEYKIVGPNLKYICQHNARVALRFKNFRAAKTWEMAARCYDNYLTGSNFGRKPTSYLMPMNCTLQQTLQQKNQGLVSLVRELIRRHSLSDLQTTAMLCCVFAKATIMTKDDLQPKIIKHGKSETIFSDKIDIQRRNRSECLNDSKVKPVLDSAMSDFGGLNELKISMAELMKHWEKLDAEEEDEPIVEQEVLDPSLTNIYDAYRLFYSEMLRRCGLLVPAVEVSHLLVSDPNMNQETKVGLVYKCPKCLTPTKDMVCTKCKVMAGPKCAYCGLRTKGHACICLNCGHGGHLLHMEEWFETNDVCASGCGCECLNLNCFE